MKIGIYLGDIKKPESVGDLTFELSFIDELKKLKTQHDFIIYYFGPKNRFKNQENIRFTSLNYLKKPDISFYPFEIRYTKIPICSLNHRLKKDNINLVVFLTPYLHEHIELPYFAIIRDVSHRILPHFPEFNTTSIFEKKERKFNLFLTSASKLITCNEIAKKDIKTLYDIISDNITTIGLPAPNWMKTTNEDNEILSQNNLSKDSYILYPAQFWTHKNHIRLILAAQIMQEQNINLKVVFTGQDRGNKDYLINQVKELDLEEYIIFLDYVNHSQLASLYKNAYAVVYPSLAGVDSISALEAIYYNCPVLISNHTGYNQQLNKSVLYFNPLDESDIVDKILLLNDLSLKDDLIKSGENLIKEYSIKNYTDKLMNITDSFYLTRMCWSLEENYKNK